MVQAGLEATHALYINTGHQRDTNSRTPTRSYTNSRTHQHRDNLRTSPYPCTDYQLTFNQRSHVMAKRHSRTIPPKSCHLRTYFTAVLDVLQLAHQTLVRHQFHGFGARLIRSSEYAIGGLRQFSSHRRLTFDCE